GYSTRYRAPSPRPTSAVDAKSTCKPPNVETTPTGTLSRSAAVGVDSPASPIADTVSGETRTSTGTTSWKASVSLASLTVILTRARPIDRPAASKRTSTEPPAGTSTVCGAADANCMISGSRLSIVTVAGPAVFNWLVTTAP